jgi:hypothetical protein
MFTDDMRKSLDPNSSLVVIIFDHEKNEFVDPKVIDSTVFSSSTSIRNWIRNTRNDQTICKKLSETISAGYISFLQVTPRDTQQVSTLKLIPC